MSKPRILILDIETSPHKGYFWGLFDQNIGLSQLEEPGRTIVVGYQWFGERKVHVLDERDGARAMFAKAHAVLVEADAVVTYNGDSFDLPRLAGAFVEHRLPPMPPVTSIDLIKTARKLGGASNKLEYIARRFGIGEKIKAGGMQLWLDCLAGLASAWARMRRYNAQDVRLTGRLYRLFRPYIVNHPYLGSSVRLLVGSKVVGTCPRCRSTRIQSRGTRRTRAMVIQRLQCLGCGGWHDGRKEKAK